MPFNPSLIKRRDYKGIRRDYKEGFKGRIIRRK